MNKCYFRKDTRLAKPGKRAHVFALLITDWSIRFWLNGFSIIGANFPILKVKQEDFLG